jgi:Uri superfamily endonuclease
VKDAASISYVGCTAAQLRKHLERQFQPGMTWQNHGEWHIDHIIPLAAFDFAAFPAQIKQAEHYTNLRPMWAAENISKCDTLPHPVQLELIAV